MSPADEIVTASVDRKSTVKQIAHFTNGKIKEKSSKNLSFGQFMKSGDDRKRKHTILVAEGKDMSYVGKNFGPDATKAQSYCRYYIGAVDKINGKMRIYDSEIIQMVPKLPGFQEEEEREKQKLSIPKNMEKTVKQKVDDLTASFGSKKKKRAMDSRLRNEIRGEALEKALTSAVDVAVAENRNFEVSAGSEENQSSLIPPHNTHAERPQDVYSLDDLISQQEMDMLTTPAQIFFECGKEDLSKWEIKEEYASFILNHLAILPKATETRWVKVKLLMYLNYLMKLYCMSGRDIKGKNFLPAEWPDFIKKKLAEHYTIVVDTGSKKTRCCPARLKNKLVLTILVLCLMLDEFDLPLNDLQKDLKIGGSSIDKHCRALGCVVKKQHLTTENDSKLELRSAVLKIPLKFPENTPKKAKGRR